MKIRLSDIELNPARQPREKMNADYVQDLCDSIRNGTQLPPIVVFGLKKSAPFFLGDGWHRHEANRKIDFKEIDADIREGNASDAFKFSLGCNVEHGLRRTNADKRRAIILALESPETCEMSHRAIAELCAVSDKTVTTICDQVRNSAPEKKTADSGRKDEKDPPKRTGKDGKRQSATKSSSKKTAQKKDATVELSERVQRAIRDGQEWRNYASVLHTTLSKKGSVYGHCPAYFLTALSRLHKSLELVVCPDCGGKRCEACAEFGVIMKHPFPAKP